MAPTIYYLIKCGWTEREVIHREKFLVGTDKGIAKALELAKTYLDRQSTMNNPWISHVESLGVLVAEG